MKTRIYIDGFNLYYSLFFIEKEYKFLDPVLLVENLLHHTELEIDVCKYFTAKVFPTDTDQHKAERQNLYWRALEEFHGKEKFQIIKGHFARKSRKGKVEKPEECKDKIVQIKMYEEKKSDVNIASHMLKDVYTTDVEHIVLISNDSDLSEPLRIVHETTNKKVTLICPIHKYSFSGTHGCSRVAVSKNLTRYASNVIRFILPGIIKKSQLPDTLKVQSPWKKIDPAS
ncbi:MAG: NYN domain-containing protein [Patescibacteria group bacterium]|nr:NYN domain-containing protein [Patescibacteria group bacterium]